jgi:hypothetical protein
MAKTRMQLQGELVPDLTKRVYRNAPDVLVKTWRNEGVNGLQRGLGAAVSSLFPDALEQDVLNENVQYVYQMIVNGCRLGWLSWSIGWSVYAERFFKVFTSHSAAHATSSSDVPPRSSLLLLQYWLASLAEPLVVSSSL